VNTAHIATILTVTALWLTSCDPPDPPIGRARTEYQETCTDVPRSQLDGGVAGVTGGFDVAAVRRIEGVDPGEAFAITHDNPECPDEAPGDWLLAHRLGLGAERRAAIRRSLRSS